MSSEVATMPEEFAKVIKDFVNDMKTTFPEYNPLIEKWWKGPEKFAHIQDAVEREAAMKKGQEASSQFLFKYCLKKYPPRFFDILNQTEEIFTENSEVDTEFLPFIHFKNLWQDDISDGTRQTIWKYLQLILFSVVGSLKNRDAFGDTAKMFDSINEDEFKSKLEESLDQIKGIFEHKADENGNELPQPNADQLHDHLYGMFTGKLGELAKEIAEETAGELDFDVGGATDVNEVFQNMFKNPGKLMGLVKNVGSKLETRMKAGDINEADLMKEASEMLNKMKNMPGMGNIQSMLSKLGMNTNGAKVDVKGMEARLSQNMKTEQMKDRIRQKAEMMRVAKEMAAAMPPKPLAPPQHVLSEAELDTMLDSVDSAETKKNSNKDKSKSKGKSKGKGKGKK
jgi:hypothetical protein